ncbi:sulfur carrier protein ThiS [Streptomyces sp. NBC_01190]|uniref:sulfur carrier protein ThiS n=1 Tax=Streptomyces sp. NBC_01190 TaxID=2903767 RepID=UPI00386D659A|nr:sulfur carrier protein ThiS [Streptomyces sp. NBC_01190]
MTITVLLNGERRELTAPCTLAALVATLTTAHKGVAAALNEAVVPRTGWPAAVLADGDRVEILTAAQGG